MRRSVLDIVTALVGVCVLAITALVVKDRVTPQTPLTARESRTIENWKGVAQAGQWIGSETATTVLIEFGDYQCPACRSFQLLLEDLLKEYPEELAIAYRHFPLPQHPFAYNAARAAECAAEQGAFEAFHRRLYADVDWLGDAFRRFASDAGVHNLPAFEDCMGRRDPVPRIEADIQAARDLQISGTPGVIVNGLLFGYTPGRAEIEELIEQNGASGGA